MPETVPMPPQFTSTERPFMWVFTIKQTLILGAGASVAGIVALYLPLGLSLLQQAILGLMIFGFFFIGGVGRYKDTPLLVFLGTMLVFKLKPKRFVKTEDNKESLYPPTQNWLRVSEVKEEVAKLRGDSYITLLKVKPIDVDLRTADAMDLVYSRLALMYNTIDFPIQIIISPVEYDSAPYLKDWKSRMEQYPEDSVERQHIRDHVQAFLTTIERVNLTTKNFYVCIPVRASQVAPDLIRQQKEDLSVVSYPAEKQKIRDEYGLKLYAKVAGELRSRRGTVANALANIDEAMTVEELSGDQLIKALAECYAGGGLDA